MFFPLFLSSCILFLLKHLIGWFLHFQIMLKPQEKVVAKPGKFVFLMDGLVDGLSKEK